MNPKQELCFCGGKVTEWKSGTEIYLQCDKCQLRTTTYGNTDIGREQLYFQWKKSFEIWKACERKT